MKIFIGTDHAGYNLKTKIVEYINKKYADALSLTDLSPILNDGDDYPVIARDVCNHILSEQEDTRGILICDTGIGMSIVANRFKGIRASLCQSVFEVVRAREHNNANVLCLGEYILSEGNEYMTLVDIFINTEFSQEERHIRRINEIDS